jgi:hypothetical protein
MVEGPARHRRLRVRLRDWMDRLGMTALLTVDEARAAVEECRRDEWKCRTCRAPTAEDSEYCWSCESYWNDCRDGLWDESSE